MHSDNQQENKSDEYVSHLLNVNNIAQNLIDVPQGQFERFFEKLYNLDKGFLYSFINFYYSKFDKEQISFAKHYFEFRGITTDWHIKKKSIGEILKLHSEKLKIKKDYIMKEKIQLINTDVLEQLLISAGYGEEVANKMEIINNYCCNKFKLKKEIKDEEFLINEIKILLKELNLISEKFYTIKNDVVNENLLNSSNEEIIKGLEIYMNLFYE